MKVEERLLMAAETGEDLAGAASSFARTSAAESAVLLLALYGLIAKIAA